MGRIDRTIKLAHERLSDKILIAEKTFKNKKDAFKVRRQFHNNEIDIYCRECGQKLNISTSKYDNLHFKHQPNADYCILKDGNMSSHQIERFNNVLLSKESQRHKELKNKIAKSLSNVEGIEPTSIFIDNKYIIRGNEKRRPDVYCKYFDKEIVFEIQLSGLSLNYILSRTDFYKKHGIYIIWILDNFDVHRQKQFERDIKYLSKYQNFFKFDETVDDFRLECEYKIVFLTNDNRLLSKWIEKSISLNELKFDSSCYQIYYYDFDYHYKKTEEEQKQKELLIEESILKRKRNKKYEFALKKVDNISKRIDELYKRKVMVYLSVEQMIKDLDEFEISLLNSILNFQNINNAGEPLLHEKITKADSDDIPYFRFILDCKNIEVDVNEKDSKENSVLMKVYQNKNIHTNFPISSLFKRGYILSGKDEHCIRSLTNRGEYNLYKICNKLKNRNLVDSVFRYSKLLYIIESARLKEMVGFNYQRNEWIAFANNAIQNYEKFWSYIEKAFKYYGLWDRLFQLDKKRTFSNKVSALYLKKPQQQPDFDILFNELYPELVKNY